MSDRASRVYFQYVRTNRRNNPVVCAYRSSEQVMEDGSSVVTVTIAASFCHRNDRFDRGLGRSIAEGRLNSKPNQFQFVRNEERNYNVQLSYEVSQYIIGLGHDAPTRMGIPQKYGAKILTSDVREPLFIG